MAGKAREIGPRRIAHAGIEAAFDGRDGLAGVEIGCERRGSYGNPWAQQESRNRRAIRDTRVEGEPGIDLIAERIFRPGKRFLEPCHLLCTQTAIRFSAFATQYGRVEVACVRREDQAVFNAIFFITGLENRVSDQLPVAIRKELAGHCFACRILRRRCVKGRFDVC